MDFGGSYERVYVGPVNWLVGGLMLTIALLAILVVFSDYLPLPSVELGELARLCLIWMAFVAMGALEFDRRHIRVTYFVEKLSGNRKRVVEAMVLVVCVVTMVVYAISSVLAIQGFGGNLSQHLKYPIALLYLAIAIGSLSMLITYAIRHLTPGA